MRYVRGLRREKLANRRESHMAKSKSSGRLDYSDEGYAVVWDADGLHIETLDYHVGTLSLSWETILDLARRARPEAFGRAVDRTLPASGEGDTQNGE
jgi:hypothetical protein